MSWLWGSSKSTKDATSDLDPELRDFLDKETARTQADAKPSQPATTPRRAANGPSREYAAQLGLDTPGLQQKDQFTPTSVPERTTVPAESQFQDGRYANLWKTYRSQEELATSSMTDQDKLAAMLGGLKDRKAAICRAAIENCVVEQLEQHMCFVKGSYYDLASMCSQQSKAFNRCYEMQARFLKALGYLSMPRSDEEEERIQMHADTLYQRMMEREKLTEAAAQENGAELQPAKPLIDGEEAVKVLGEESAYARMRREAMQSQRGSVLASYNEVERQKIIDKIKDMDEDQKALELQLIAAEARVKHDVQQQVAGHWKEEVMNRRKRREEGKETIGDKVKRYGGWQQ